MSYFDLLSRMLYENILVQGYADLRSCVYDAMYATAVAICVCAYVVIVNDAYRDGHADDGVFHLDPFISNFNPSKAYTA